jgi:hypothetical protein
VLPYLEEFVSPMTYMFTTKERDRQEDDSICELTTQELGYQPKFSAKSLDEIFDVVDEDDGHDVIRCIKFKKSFMNNTRATAIGLQLESNVSWIIDVEFKDPVDKAKLDAADRILFDVKDWYEFDMHINAGELHRVWPRLAMIAYVWSEDLNRSPKQRKAAINLLRNSITELASDLQNERSRLWSEPY